MRYFFAIILISIGCLMMTSCEEVVTLDLTGSAPRLVIEGFITDQPGPYTVRISQSTDFYNTNDFPEVNGANVVMTDDLGNQEVLEEVNPGQYQTQTITGQRGVTYTLQVQIDDQLFTATSKMPADLIPLDSISFRFEEESLFYDEGYYVTAYYNDPPITGNYYRHNIFVNGEVYDFDLDGEIVQDDNFWLSRDKFSDGNLQDYEFPHTLELGDSVAIELHNLNKSTFEYYRTLVDVIDGGGVAPSNPVTNFDNNALGYFGAFSVTSIKGKVEKKN